MKSDLLPIGTRVEWERGYRVLTGYIAHILDQNNEKVYSVQSHDRLYIVRHQECTVIKSPVALLPLNSRISWNYNCRGLTGYITGISERPDGWPVYSVRSNGRVYKVLPQDVLEH